MGKGSNNRFGLEIILESLIVCNCYTIFTEQKNHCRAENR